MENMNINEKEVQGTVTQKETAGEKEGTEQKEQLRTFTQDEVNDIGEAGCCRYALRSFRADRLQQQGRVRKEPCNRIESI